MEQNIQNLQQVEVKTKPASSKVNSFALGLLIFLAIVGFNSLFILQNYINLILSFPYKIIDLIILMNASEAGSDREIVESSLWLINLLIIPVLVGSLTLLFSFLGLKAFGYHRAKKANKEPRIFTCLSPLISFPIGLLYTVIGVAIAIFLVKYLLIDHFSLMKQFNVDNFFTLLSEDNKLTEVLVISFVGPMAAGFYSALLYSSWKIWDIYRRTK